MPAISYRRGGTCPLFAPPSPWTGINERNERIRCIFCLVYVDHEPVPCRAYEPVLRHVLRQWVPAIMKLQPDAAVTLDASFALRQPSAETPLEFASCHFILTSVEVFAAAS